MEPQDPQSGHQEQVAAHSMMDLKNARMRRSKSVHDIGLYRTIGQNILDCDKGTVTRMVPWKNPQCDNRIVRKT